MSAAGFIREQPDGVLLSIKLQPRASDNKIVDVSGDELRVRVTAPPVDSAANDALIRFLAEELDLPRNRVMLVRGATSRHKVVKLSGTSAASIRAKLSSM
jgi:uncharacterized protein (TIGR00251 family)